MIRMFNADSMTAMAAMPDKAYELAIVDPPYFERGGDPAYYRSRACQSTCRAITATWDIPGADYFGELFRVSKRQIIWGVNYYAQFIPHFSRIVWDKVNDGTPFSQADIASYSEGVKVYMFRYKWNGMIQADMKNKEHRIHPTQKPVALYEWLLKNYAKPGDRILDTHGGSGSIAIACDITGVDLDWYEIDNYYFTAATERLERHQKQGVLAI
jgi:site-specific DNA-methyltransferase (adenine-specific)